MSLTPRQQAKRWRAAAYKAQESADFWEAHGFPVSAARARQRALEHEAKALACLQKGQDEH